MALCVLHSATKQIRAHAPNFVSSSPAMKVAQNALLPLHMRHTLYEFKDGSSATELSNGTWHHNLGGL